MIFNANAGDDFFQFNNIVFDNVTMVAGDGDDQLQSGSGITPNKSTPMGFAAAVASGSVGLLQNISFNGGNGADCVDFIRTFGGAAWKFNLGSGNDSFTTNWGSSGAINALGDAHNDYFALTDHTAQALVVLDGVTGSDFISGILNKFYGDLLVLGGAGYDTIAFDTNSFLKNVVIDGGSESDYLLFAANTVQGQVTLLGGHGYDTIIVGWRFAGTVGANVAKKLVLDGGSETDKVRIGKNTFDDFFALLGSGDDEVTIDGQLIGEEQRLA